MAHIGSVFLGDVQRHRMLSTSTPPSSPPPPTSPNTYHAFPDAIPENPPSALHTAPSSNIAPTKVTPEIAFELRTRLLETLVVGVQRDPRTTAARADGKHPTLSRDIEEVQRKLDTLVHGSGSDALKWFVDNCASCSFCSLFYLTNYSSQTTSTSNIYHLHLRYQGLSRHHLRCTRTCLPVRSKHFWQRWSRTFGQQTVISETSIC